MLALPSEPLVCFSFQTHAGSNQASVLAADFKHKAKKTVFTLNVNDHAGTYTGVGDKT